MAQRRMFSRRITNSSSFLMMSQSAQSLYFHLGMNADDDGFCEVFTLMRMTDSKPDDLKALHERGLIHIVDSRICIVIDWHENNQLRPDRYSRSEYLKNDKEMEKLYLGVMSDKIAKISLYDDLATKWQPNGNQMATNGCRRLGKDRLGKDRLGEVRLGKPPTGVLGGEEENGEVKETDVEEIDDVKTNTSQVSTKGRKQKDAKCQTADNSEKVLDLFVSTGLAERASFTAVDRKAADKLASLPEFESRIAAYAKAVDSGSAAYITNCRRPSAMLANWKYLGERLAVKACLNKTGITI